MKYELTTALPDFVKMLKSLVKFRKKLTKTVVLSWSEGLLTIDLSESGVEIPASGDWPGAVRVRGEFILSLARIPPAEDPLSISVREDRLWVGKCSFPCTTETGTRRRS
jgi:hypothetical protein